MRETQSDAEDDPCRTEDEDVGLDEEVIGQVNCDGDTEVKRYLHSDEEASDDGLSGTEEENGQREDEELYVEDNWTRCDGDTEEKRFIYMLSEEDDSDDEEAKTAERQHKHTLEQALQTEREHECPICTEPYDTHTHARHHLHPPAHCALCRACLYRTTAHDTLREGRVVALVLSGYTRNEAECLVGQLDENDSFPLGVFHSRPMLRCPYDRALVTWDQLSPPVPLMEADTRLFRVLFRGFEVARIVLTPLAVATYCVRVVDRLVTRHVPANPLLASVVGALAPILPGLYAPALRKWTEAIVVERLISPAPLHTILWTSFVAGLLCDVTVSSVRDVTEHVLAQPAALHCTPPLTHTLTRAMASASVHALVNVVGGGKALGVLALVMLLRR